MEQMNKIRFAVISDIHGNYEAFIKAMSIIKKRNVDKIICLGDIIGYGANPNECLEYAKNNIDIVLCGNHDFYQINKPQNINKLCKISTEWTEKILNNEWINYLNMLPISYSWGGFGFYHTIIERRGEWLYLNDLKDIISAFSYKENVCFYGHTHRSRITIIEADKVIKDKFLQKTDSFIIDLKKQKAFINPGSIGQQRDNKTDLSFVICEQNMNLLKVYIERHKYCAIKPYIKIKYQGCGANVADYLIREYSKKKIYRIIGRWIILCKIKVFGGNL